MVYKIFSLFIILAYSICARAQLYIQSGATFKTTNNAIVCLQDMDWVDNIGISQFPGEGRLVFSGTSGNTLSGSVEPLLDILEIAKTGSGILTLNRSIAVGSAIQFTSGLIELNNNTITLETPASLIGENETSRITGTGGGFLQIAVRLNAPFGANPGNLGAVITSSQNLGTTYVRRAHVAQTNSSGASGINRYYDIIPVNDTLLDAELDLHYFDAELNGVGPAALQVFKSKDTGATWSNLGTGIWAPTSKFAGIFHVNDFSRWTLASINNPLPVTLLSFKAVCGNNNEQISWVTATEMNTAGFELEKSGNAASWNKIGTVPATDNISGSSYTFTDPNPDGEAFYRIRTIDKDGHFSYSPIFSGNCADFTRPILLYPNPAHSEMMAQIAIRRAAGATIKLFTAAGQQVYASPYTLAAGNNQVRIPVYMLPPGSYSIKISIAGGQSLQASFIKL